MSALTGYGMDTLRAEIAALLASLWVDVDVCLPYTAGELLARVRERGTVELEYGERDVRVVGRVAPPWRASCRRRRRWAEGWSAIARRRSRRRQRPTDDRSARVAGWGTADDGSIVIWTVSEGRKGRRWREVVPRGGSVQSLLLETGSTAGSAISSWPVPTAC